MIEVSHTKPTAPELSPVFVFGADHSGTTILYRMLAYHRHLTWFSQFSLRRGQIPGRSRRPVVDRLDRRLRFRLHPWTKEDSRLARLFVPYPGEEGTIWTYLLEDGATDAARIRSHLTAFSKRFGGRRVLAKRPAFYQHLDLLSTAFPRASYVHIVRDGRPVALSLRAKALETKRRGDGERDEAGSALEAAARRWVEVLDRADQAPGIDMIEVRYEDLCSDVHATIRAVLRHLRLDLDSFAFQRCPPKLSSRNSHWVNGATASELRLISQIESDQLARRGYRST